MFWSKPNAELVRENKILKRQVLENRRKVEQCEHCLCRARQIIERLGKSNRELEALRRETSKADIAWRIIKILFVLLTDKVPHRKPGERQEFYNQIERELREVA